MKKPAHLPGISLGYASMTAHIPKNLLFISSSFGRTRMSGYIRWGNLNTRSPTSFCNAVVSSALVWQRILKINPDLARPPTCRGLVFSILRTTYSILLPAGSSHSPYPTSRVALDGSADFYLFDGRYFSFSKTLQKPFTDHLALLPWHVLWCLPDRYSFPVLADAYHSSVSARSFLVFGCGYGAYRRCLFATRPAHDPRHSTWAPLFLHIGPFFLYHPSLRKDTLIQVTSSLFSRNRYARIFLKTSYNHPGNILLIISLPWGLADTEL